MDIEDRLKKIEQYLSKSNQFQTDVIESVLLKTEGRTPMGFGKWLSQDYPALTAVFSTTKGTGFANISTEQRDRMAVNILTRGIVIFNTDTSTLQQWDGVFWNDANAPIYTTVQRDALTGVNFGAIIFNSDTFTLDFFNGLSWVSNNGSVMPSYTTTERDAILLPATGMTIFNSTTSKINFYNGTAWAAVTSV
jgi:hypothetical protein